MKDAQRPASQRAVRGVRGPARGACGGESLSVLLSSQAGVCPGVTRRVPLVLTGNGHVMTIGTRRTQREPALPTAILWARPCPRGHEKRQSLNLLPASTRELWRWGATAKPSSKPEFTDCGPWAKPHLPLAFINNSPTPIGCPPASAAWARLGRSEQCNRARVAYSPQDIDIWPSAYRFSVPVLEHIARKCSLTAHPPLLPSTPATHAQVSPFGTPE